MYSKFIEDIIAKYPEGLSRGLDNDIKYEMYNNVIKELKGTKVEVWYTILNEVNPDHYVTFIANNKLYIYSQPYGQIANNVLTNYQREGWDIEYSLDNSWYFPNRCITLLYSRPLTNYFMYKTIKANVIWVMDEELEPADMKYKKFKELT